MNSRKFFNEIILTKPTKEELLNAGHGLEVNDMFSDFFTITKNKNKSEYEDPIIDFIKNYDVASLNIHDITFDTNLVQDDRYIFFGWDVNDRLAILKSNNNIIAYDTYSDRLMFQCAENSSMFLDALVELLRFFKEKILKDIAEDEQQIMAKKIAYICALKAGGEQYEDYFKSILGIEY